MPSHILVVDDDPAMRMLISTILQHTAIVVEASNGQEALAYVAERECDLILLDWQMPAPDGLEVLKKTRAAGLQTPIVMVTADASRANVLTALAAGASDYLIKPFSSDELDKKVRKHCPANPTPSIQPQSKTS